MTPSPADTLRALVAEAQKAPRGYGTLLNTTGPILAQDKLAVFAPDLAAWAADAAEETEQALRFISDAIESLDEDPYDEPSVLKARLLAAEAVLRPSLARLSEIVGEL